MLIVNMEKLKVEVSQFKILGYACITQNSLIFKDEDELITLKL